MFLILLLVVLMWVGVVLTDITIYLPLNILNWLHLPSWLTLVLVILAFSWLFGED